MIRRLLPQLLIGINIVWALLLLLSFLSPYLPPGSFSFFWLLGLLFPLLWLVNLFFIAGWLLYKKYRSTAISMALIVITLPGVLRNFSFFPTGFGGEARYAFTLMTYNVKNFDLYNWSGNIAAKDEMFKLIAKKSPDILCIQEFYTDGSAHFNNLEALRKLYPYSYFKETLVLRGDEYWGLATFSRFPILKAEVIRFENSKHNLCLVTDLLLDQDTIRLFNAHLQSVRLIEEEYETIARLGTGDRNKESGYASIFQKVSNASKMRAYQSNIIAEQIALNPGPVIVCGDFNDTPNSYTYRTLTAQLSDAFHQTQWGLGSTFNKFWLPLRIDYVLLSNQLRAKEYETLKEPHSDHYPIFVEIALLDD